MRSCLKLINGIAFKTKDVHRYTDEVIATLRQAQDKLPRCYEKLPLNRAWQQWRHKKTNAGTNKK